MIYYAQLQYDQKSKLELYNDNTKCLKIPLIN